MFSFLIHLISCFYLFDYIHKILALFRNRNKKIIIVTGSIGVGKTLFASKLCAHIERNGKSAMLTSDIGKRDMCDISSMYDTIERFKISMKKISEIGRAYDYIILDRSHLDFQVFTRLNNMGEVMIKIFDKGLMSLRLPYDIASVVYVKPSLEDVLLKYPDDGDYLTQSYDTFDSNVHQVYPDNLITYDGTGSEEFIENHFKFIDGMLTIG